MLLDRRYTFRFIEVAVEDKRVVVLEIGRAFRHPVKFQNEAYFRLGSYKKKLKDAPERERDLWRELDQTPFEKGIAADRLAADEVLRQLDHPAYFELLECPLPDGTQAILTALEQDDLVSRCEAGGWNITNLGVILFAKRLDDFGTVRRKAMRVIVYKARGRE